MSLYTATQCHLATYHHDCNAALAWREGGEKKNTDVSGSLLIRIKAVPF
jgi:hypothetical protein